MKIHGHPQKTDYASPAEWPTLDGQAWTGSPDPMEAGHVHITVTCPLYGVVENLVETVEIPFVIKAHELAGRVGGVYGPYVRSVRYKDTGTSDPPDMLGDPDGVKEWAGVATIDYDRVPPDDFLGLYKFPLHGWQEIRLQTQAALDNGRRMDSYTSWSVYSLIDPAVEEKKAPEQGNPGVNFRSSVTVWQDPGGAIVGEVIMEVSDYIPLLPFDTPWTTIANAYNYTAPVTVEFNERFERRLDADLHHGKAGTLQQ